MFTFGGNNNFKDRFDFYEWSAPYYENSDEVFTALNKIGLKGKTLTAINAIGAINESIGNGLYWTITDSGVTLDNNWMESYEHLDKVRVPWSIELCEPIQLVFDDGTTVEILPIEDGGARIGVNTIPVGLVNGLNPSEVDATSFFGELIGHKLDNITLCIDSNEKRWIDKNSIQNKYQNKRTETKYIIEFEFDFPYKLKLTQEWESWYRVCGVGNEYRGKVTYQRFNSTTFQDDDTVKITTGRDGGGTFWIMGLRDKEKVCQIPNLDCFGISIDDYYVSEYLSEFLYKYFDESIQEREEYEEPDFDWYGVNLYSCDSMRKMINEIKETINLLQTNYDAPSLDKIKSNWNYISFLDTRIDKLEEHEINEQRKKLVPVAIDFYERFCRQIENMMKIPGVNIISFAGP